jgi:hypothetical protein
MLFGKFDQKPPGLLSTADWLVIPLLQQSGDAGTVTEIRARF